MNMSMRSGVLALRANTAMAHAANTGLALNRKTADTNANAPMLCTGYASKAIAAANAMMATTAVIILARRTVAVLANPGVRRHVPFHQIATIVERKRPGCNRPLADVPALGS
jgi:hypothetical protein